MTPSSGKDFPREFTARIHERCQLPTPKVTTTTAAQQTTTILDPLSGKVTTILSTVDTSSSPKKPSYLNLACCVNGYSNLTTYDSKLRQNINKSREVSPNRPITHTIQYNRSQGNNYLVVPLPVKIELLSDPIMEKKTSSMSTEKRIFTSQMFQETSTDTTDNISTKLYKTVTKQTNIVVTNGSNGDIPAKSFIQQRAERLYGPCALAQGFYTNKRVTGLNDSINYSNTNNSTNLSEKYINNTQDSQNNIHLTSNGKNSLFNDNDDENLDNLKKQEQALPVLRHLRPEFRAQLPISPKRSTIKIIPESDSSPLPPQSSNEIICNKQPPTNGDIIDIESSKDVNKENVIVGSGVKQHENGNGFSHNIPDSEKDGRYFLVILKIERDRLLNLATKTEEEMNEILV